MAKRITCPACGSRGEVGDDVAFEVRGQFQGRLVQRCLECGSGVFVKPPLGRTEVIPHDLWVAMQARWVEEFGEPAAEPDQFPVIGQAVAALWEEVPDDTAAAVMVLASAAHDIAGAALRLVAAEHDAWSGLNVAEAKGAVRTAAAYYVEQAGADDDLKRHFADWLDIRPSDVPASLMSAYGAACLTLREQNLLGDLKKARAGSDNTKYAMALGRLIAFGAGRRGALGIDEVISWRSALADLRETFGQHFLSELERFASEA